MLSLVAHNPSVTNCCGRGSKHVQANAKLIPVNSSSLTKSVFAYARELAGRLGINLLFLNVSSPEEYELLPNARCLR